MRKLNNKNKLFILLFSIIVLGIVAILIYSVKLSKGNNLSTVYSVSSNSVIYDYETNLIDTKKGGEIEKSWDNNYYYTNPNKESYDLGVRSVIYEKAVEEVLLLGDNYKISSTGSIVKNTDKTSIKNTDESNFYKLDDRVYLIVSNEIYNEDKTIFTSKYLIVTLDKQGNASLLNDVTNIKTINPMVLLFDNYKFDIANEKLIVNNNTIDLKLVNGSTNEYVAKDNKEVFEEVDMTKFINSYNKLVNDFTKYTKNNNLLVSGNNQVVNNTTIISNTNKDNTDVTTATNKTNITKRVSLRGTISYPTYIDITYVVTDPEDKYQAVYLLVTGIKEGEMTTEKILLDKYDTKHRITGLNPKNEYTISLGYVEVIQKDKTNELYDYIEDVINVRTTGCDAKISINKITPGYVSFTFNMTKKYAIESGKIVLYSNGSESDSVFINYNEALSEKGFSGKLKLEEANVYELRLENAVYNSKKVELNVAKKFTYQSLGVSK